jgi:two-component system chemotaxis response regulator CheY
MPQPRRALVVDDEAHVRVFLKLLLRELGIEVCGEAGDGARALELINELQPELVLLDLNMPQLGGLEVLRQIQEERPDLPVIVVSSQSAMKTVQEVAQLGAIGYVLKHASKNEALRALREALATLENEPSA